MSSSENQKSKSASNLIDAGLAKEPLAQLRSASGHTDTVFRAGPSFEDSAALPEVADSGISPLGNRPASPDGDNLFAFYASAGHSPQELRPNLVDAVIEQLRHARLRRQRPH